jgi:UDP-3-O-[3-hydroxymyristoyl] glucosamine N-acyltransferase
MTFTAQQIADYLAGFIEGDSSIKVSNVSRIEEGIPGTLTFLSNPKYTPYIYTTEASIVLVNRDFIPERPIKATLIRVDNAYESLARLLDMVNSSQQVKPGIDPMASIASTAQLGDNGYVGAFSYIDEQVVIGENVQSYPQVYIGRNVQIGDDCILYPGVKIMHDCHIGNRCILQAGVVIGGDGFGFAPSKEGEFQKIAQIGNVILEDDVEVGANTTIDRPRSVQPY